MNEIGSVLDTDVLLKVAAFRLGNELLGILRGRGGIGVLKVAHLIAASQLRKNPRIRARDDAQRELQSMLENLTALEPDNAEIEIAAELAEAALLQGLPLDAGDHRRQTSNCGARTGVGDGWADRCAARAGSVLGTTTEGALYRIGL